MNEIPYRSFGWLGLMACAALGLTGMESRAETVMESVITEFSADRRAVSAAYDVPWAEATLDRETALLHSWQTRVEALNYETLPPPQRIDWHLMRNHLRSEIDALALDRGRLVEMEPLLAFRRPLQTLLTKQAQRQDIDPEAAAGVFAEALTRAGTVEGSPGRCLETKPGPRTAVCRSDGSAAGLPGRMVQVLSGIPA